MFKKGANLYKYLKSPISNITDLLRFIWKSATKRLITTEYVIATNKIQHELKITQLSDLHCNTFGKNNDVLLQKIKRSFPDIIVITGDFFDTLGEEVPKQLLINLLNIAPVFYSPGNHEYDDKDQYQENYLPFLKKNGVVVLDNSLCFIEVKGQRIQISGLGNRSDIRYDFEFFEAGLDFISEKQSPSYFQLLLAHMPDYFELYNNYNYDLILCGHTHGGHIRVPFTKIGIIAAHPQHKILPKYAYGRHENNNQTMIISSGLGCGSFLQKIIPRIGNPYEIVNITIIPE